MNKKYNLLVLITIIIFSTFFVFGYVVIDSNDDQVVSDNNADDMNQNQVVTSDIDKYNYECENKKAIETCSEDGSYWIKTYVKDNNGIHHPFIYCTINKQYYTKNINDYPPTCQISSSVNNQYASSDNELYNYECKNKQKQTSCSDGSYWVKTYVKDSQGIHHSSVYCSNNGDWQANSPGDKCPVIDQTFDKNKQIYDQACKTEYNNKIQEESDGSYWILTDYIVDSNGKCHPVTYCNSDKTWYTSDLSKINNYPTGYTCNTKENEKIYDKLCEERFDNSIKTCSDNSYWIKTTDIKDYYGVCHPATYCNSDKTWYKGNPNSITCQTPIVTEKCTINNFAFCSLISITMPEYTPTQKDACYDYYTQHKGMTDTKTDTSTETYPPVVDNSPIEDLVLSTIDIYNNACQTRQSVSTCSDGYYWISTNDLIVENNQCFPLILCTNKKEWSSTPSSTCPVPSSLAQNCIDLNQNPSKTKGQFIDVGSKISNGKDNTVKLCGLAGNGKSFSAKGYCEGDWIVNPCDWNTYCSTGWVYEQKDVIMNDCTSQCVKSVNFASNIGLRALPRSDADLPIFFNQKEMKMKDKINYKTFDELSGEYPFVAQNLDVVKDYKGNLQTNDIFFEHYIGMDKDGHGVWDKGQWIDTNLDNNQLIKAIQSYESQNLNVKHIIIARESELYQATYPNGFPGKFQDSRILYKKDVEDIRSIFQNAYSQGKIKHYDYKLIQMVFDPVYFFTDPEALEVINMMDGVAVETHHYNIYWPIDGKIKKKELAQGANWVLSQYNKDFILIYGPFLDKTCNQDPSILPNPNYDGLGNYYTNNGVPVEKDWLNQYWAAGLPKQHSNMYYYINTFPHECGKYRPVGPESNPDSITGFTKWLIEEVK